MKKMKTRKEEGKLGKHAGNLLLRIRSPVAVRLRFFFFRAFVFVVVDEGPL